MVGVDENEDIYLLDCWWSRQPSDVVVKAMIELIKRHKPLIWWAEKGHITKAIGPFLRKRMLETKTHCRIEEVTPVANKVQRSQSIIGRMAMKKVFFPKVSPWTQKAVDEVLKFPNSRHDDFVDSLAWIGMGLGQLHSPSAPARKNLLPKFKTMAWVKWQSELESRRSKTLSSGF